MVFAIALMLAAGPENVAWLDYDAPLKRSDYEGRSLRELTLMRNFPYAQAHNSFRRTWLREYFQDHLKGYYGLETMDESVLTDVMRANAEAVATYEASLTKDELIARRDAVRARLKEKKGTPEDDIELRLLSVRLGGWAGDGDAPADLSALEAPDKLDKLLKLSDLNDFSPRDLKLLRNTVFARRGRPFKTPLVQGHFKTVLWYAADPKYADARLTELDKKNVQLILSLEKKLNRAAQPDEPPDKFYMRA
jgi:hypothetical protein